MPAVSARDALLAEVAARNPEVSFLYVNQGEAPEAIRTYLNSLGFAMGGAVLLDPRQAVRQVQKVVGLPTTLFYDAGGKLVSRQVGELSRPMLNAHLIRIRPRTSSE